MHDDLIREHIRRLARRDEPDRNALIAGVTSHCWPGGSADRTEPAARSWLRLWRPARMVAALPVCSCAAGHCSVCN